MDTKAQLVADEYKRAIFGSSVRPEVLKKLLKVSDGKLSIGKLAKSLQTQQNAILSSMTPLMAMQIVNYGLDIVEKDKVLVLNPADREVAKELVKLLDIIHERARKLAEQMPVMGGSSH